MTEQRNDLPRALELYEGKRCDLNPDLRNFRVDILLVTTSTLSRGHLDLIWLHELKFPVFSQENEVAMRRLHDLCPEGSSHRRRAVNWSRNSR